MQIIKNFSLQKYNTFGLDVYAEKFVELTSTEDAQKFFKEDYQKNENTIILGGGSNLLFSEKRYDGIVIKNNIPGIHVVKEDDHFFWVKAGAGVAWHTLVESSIKANFGGIENLSLIPGTVGAAPIQNIGAYGVELKDTFEALEAIEIDTGEKRYFRIKECEFGYRDSIFKRELKGKFFITHVILRLSKKPILNTSYGKVQEYLNKLGKKEFTIKDVSSVIIRIREEKLPDPYVKGNAGSFFKNPIISEQILNDIQKTYPEVPFYNQEDDTKKIPAAWLIDKCQLKGTKYNGAAIHTNQPLVLINDNQANGLDLINLSRKVQEVVKQKFGILLEPEVTIV